MAKDAEPAATLKAPSLGVLQSPLASQEAKQRTEQAEGGPFFLADWVHTLMIHYAVEPEALHGQVPMPLDLRNGLAYLSNIPDSIGLSPV